MVLFDQLTNKSNSIPSSLDIEFDIADGFFF